MKTYLQEEIIEIVLCHENLSVSDVVNFSLTNKYYYGVIRNNNTLWKKKYFQIWPQLSKFFEKHDPDFCWYEELQYGYDLKRKTREILYTMCLRFYKHDKLIGPHFSEWMNVYEETPRTFYYLVHDLKNIVNTRVAINTIEVVPISTPGNRTLQYYALKVLRYLLYSHLMEESHVRQPLRLQALETVIVFVTQWCRPNLDVSWKEIIPNKFDEWAEKVKEQLKVVHPNHPLFAVPEENLKMWREKNINGSKYDVENCKKVVQALESVLTIKIDPGVSITIFRENDLLKELAATDLTAVYGEYTSLLITCQCVARRLGLKYEIVLSDDCNRFVLTLSSNFSNAVEDLLQRLSIARREQFDLIRAVDELRFLRSLLCPDLKFLELLEALSPFNIPSKIFVKECCLDYTVYSPHHHGSVIRKITKHHHSLKSEMSKSLLELTACRTIVKDSQKVRPPNLKYAVGMAMKHVTKLDKCVIYDWDPVCTASVEWQRQNNIHLLEFKNNQPFYNILNQFGRHEYIAQECLEPSTDIAFLIMVEDIGRHFSHVFETHFVPNEAKEREYPEDAAVRHMFHQKLKAGNLNWQCK